MQKISLASMFAFFFIQYSMTAQIANQDQKKPWLSSYQESIVSLGKIAKADIGNNQSINYFSVVGSGMIFYVNAHNKTIPCLITAKHVLENVPDKWTPDKINLRLFRFQNEELHKNLGVEIPLRKNGKKLWIEPDNKSTDLACLPLLNLEEKLGISDLIIFPYRLFASKDDYFEGAQLFIFGYPGIVEPSFQTKALVRNGIVSWVSPSSPESNIILVDSDLYPGNSGGPVIKVPSPMDKFGNIVVGETPKFLGIVSAKKQAPTVLIDQNGKVVLDTLGNNFFTMESVGIGIIETAHNVKILLDKTKMLIETNKY
ncbi:S1 family peptidase [Haliscomenobacter sp.]|uniref:S1 family peptidase n=1 Tax=Haliscomenobacter sp. TaxID=2717303 RepID=UPI003BAC9EC0